MPNCRKSGSIKTKQNLSSQPPLKKARAFPFICAVLPRKWRQLRRQNIAFDFLVVPTCCRSFFKNETSLHSFFVWLLHRVVLLIGLILACPWVCAMLLCGWIVSRNEIVRNICHSGRSLESHYELTFVP